MAVQLVLTEEMIDCFHSCAKKTDYRQLFNNYPRFFVVLVENLEKVKLPDGIWQSIAKNSSLLVDILKRWHSRLSLSREETLALEEELPEFIGHFWTFGSVRDWNDFYMQYKSTADLMITHARYQDFIDFKIECKGELFENFLDRDSFLNSYNGTKEPQPAPRRRTRKIDDRNWLNQASTPDTNDYISQSTEKSTKIPEKTNEEHIPKLAQPPIFHESEVSSSDPNVGNVHASDENGESCKHLKETIDWKPQPAPRRRALIIDDNSWLMQASSTDSVTNDNFLQSEKQNTEKTEKTDEDHEPKATLTTELYENLLNSDPYVDNMQPQAAPRRRTLIIDSNSWAALASIPDSANVPHLEEETTEKFGKTDKDHTENDENLMQTTNESEASSKRNPVQRELNNADQHDEEEEPPVPRRRTLIIDDKSWLTSAPTPDSATDDSVLHSEEQTTEECKKTPNFSKFQETLPAFGEKSRLLEENNDITLQQLMTQEEQMKLREDKLRKREEELNKKVNEIRLREENLGRKMEEMLELMKQIVGNKTHTVGPSAA